MLASGFTNAELHEMREWLKECFDEAPNCEWGYIDSLSDRQILEGIGRYYRGGVAKFVKDLSPFIHMYVQ